MKDDEYITNLADEINRVWSEILKTEKFLFACMDSHVDRIKAARRAYKELKREAWCNFRYSTGKFQDQYKAMMKNLKYPSLKLLLMWKKLVWKRHNKQKKYLKL